MVAIAACVWVFFFAFRNTDAAVSAKVDAIFAAIQIGTFDEVYTRESAPELRQSITPKEWRQLGLTIQTYLGHLNSKKRSHYYVQQANSDRYVDVTYSATFEKGAGEIRTCFKNIDGEWRLAGFKVTSRELLKSWATIACPHCGETCPESAKFCPKCGKPVADHGESKAAAKNDGAHRNDLSAEATPPTPPAR
ncbi:MAG: DUF4019 domain-containing protein [Thermoguttaceae bacterium]